MFEPFIDLAREAIVRAQEEARSLGSNYIGTEHILLGLVTIPESRSARCLESQGVDHDQAREALVRIIPPPGVLDAEALKMVGIDLSAVRDKVEAIFGRARSTSHPAALVGADASSQVTSHLRPGPRRSWSWPGGGAAAAPQVHRRRSPPAWSAPRGEESCGADPGRRRSRP